MVLGVVGVEVDVDDVRTSSPVGEKTLTFRRLRRRMRALRPWPMYLPRMVDQAAWVSGEGCWSGSESGGVRGFEGGIVGVVVEGWEGDELLSSLWAVPSYSFAAPDIYTSLNARLYSLNFHSPRKPSVPMLNDSMGGTLAVDVKREEARRIVPSPPSVATRSTLSCRSAGLPDVFA